MTPFNAITGKATSLAQSMAPSSTAPAATSTVPAYQATKDNAATIATPARRQTTDVLGRRKTIVGAAGDYSKDTLG